MSQLPTIILEPELADSDTQDGKDADLQILFVNNITRFCPASMRITLAYTTVLTSPYHICGAVTTPGLWGNNATWKQWPPHILSASPATA